MMIPNRKFSKKMKTLENIIIIIIIITKMILIIIITINNKPENEINKSVIKKINFS